MVSQARLHELFEYCPSGRLLRRVALSRSSKVGESIGSSTALGYRVASVDGVTYPLHRLVWAWHGHVADAELDHINHDRGDNRIENLRPATHAQNMWNKRIQRNNTTGVKGVTWKQDKQAFSVRIGVNGRRKHIGYFKDLELASLVAQEARSKFHGAYAH